MLYTGRTLNLVKHALTLLVILLFLVLPAYSASNSTDSDVFLPINIREYEAAMGIQRRAKEDFVDMRPKPHADLIYGRPGKNQQMLLAHMRLHASNGTDIVLMERFEHLTKSVDCHGQDGTLSLTFKSKAAFKRALEAWSFINDAEEIKFLLITNHDDCSPSDQRRPYIITNIRDDRAALTTFLTALEVPWAQVAGTWDLDFGKAALPQKPVSRRILKRVDRTMDTSVSVRAGQPGSRFNILPGGRSKNDRVDCVDCYVRGYIHIMGHFAAAHWLPQAAYLEVSPEDFAAEMSLEVTVEKQGKIDKLSYEETLADVPVPGAGVVIKNILSVGLRIQFAAGFTTKLKSGITFRAGLSASLPGTSRITLDAITPWENRASGLEGFRVDPYVEIQSLSRTAEISLAAKPKLVFGIDLVNIATYEIAAIVHLPELKGTCTVKSKPGGACPDDPSALQTGVEVHAKADLEVDLQIDSVVGGQKGIDPIWQQKLWSADANVLKICFPLDIPSIKPSKSKLVASADLTELGQIFSDDPDDSNPESDSTRWGEDAPAESTEEPDSSPTPSPDMDIFSTEADGINAPATDSDPAQTDIFTPDRDLTASGIDSTTPETDLAASGTDESKIFAEVASSENYVPLSPLSESSSTTTTDPSSPSDFSNEFQSRTDPNLSPLPEFTTAPGPEPLLLALAGPGSYPESPPPADNSFPGPDPIQKMYPTSDSSSEDVRSPPSEDGSSSLLPERNTAPEGELPPLGEGSKFDYNAFLPSEGVAFSSDQDLLSFAPDESGLVQDRSSLPLDDVFTLPPEDAFLATSAEVPELGEGSNFIRTEPAVPTDSNLFLDGSFGTGTSTEGGYDGTGTGGVEGFENYVA